MADDYLSDIPDHIRVATRAAARLSGVAEDYFAALGNKESHLNPSAINRDTNATGLFQFIPSTWKMLQKKYGHQYNLTDARDPEQSGIAAGLLTKENKDTLEKRFKRPATAGDLMGAHNLGAGGYFKIADNPSSRARDILPVAAKYNRNVFGDRTGSELQGLFNQQAIYRPNTTSTYRPVSDSFSLSDDSEATRRSPSPSGTVLRNKASQSYSFGNGGFSYSDGNSDSDKQSRINSILSDIRSKSGGY